MRLLIALGGNALAGPNGDAEPDEEEAAVDDAMESVADLVADGHQVVLTHGNGPQVGNLLLKNELAAEMVAPEPLDWCVAETQASIGMLVMNALDHALLRRGRPARTAALVSRTLVDADDPALAAPTKPIGRYATAAEAAVMIEHGQQWVDLGERGWRRVVGSPQPRQCLDVAAARVLADAGYVVVCSGGGGVPTAYDENGLNGVEAVVDKDLTAALLAEELHADLLVIATDVEAAALDWGTPDARPLGEVTVAQLRAHAAEGQFAAGSMGPKVEAACRFAERTKRRAVITALDTISGGVAGTAGTQVRLE
ncbi:MAG TPA: carbamate kinase [Kribbellaceae bacterium]|jgi:carbamate kinase